MMKIKETASNSCADVYKMLPVCIGIDTNKYYKTLCKIKRIKWNRKEQEILSAEKNKIMKFM